MAIMMIIMIIQPMDSTVTTIKANTPEIRIIHQTGPLYGQHIPIKILIIILVIAHSQDIIWVSFV